MVIHGVCFARRRKNEDLTREKIKNTTVTTNKIKVRKDPTERIAHEEKIGRAHV